jgi:hypothetical protein
MVVAGVAASYPDWSDTWVLTVAANKIQRKYVGFLLIKNHPW